MKRIITTSLAAMLALGTSFAFGGTYRLTPSDADLGDLDHYYVYRWGVVTPWAQNETVVSATLKFDDLYDWTNESNRLYIHLLDTPALGIAVTYDNQGGGDSLGNEGVTLTTYSDLPTRAQDLSYSFTQAQLDWLNLFGSDGRFGVGFDPDCHFYNSGVALELVTAGYEVPEPATMGVLALGGGLLILRRRRSRK